MKNSSVCKLWLTIGIVSFPISIIKFMQNLYIDSFSAFAFSISALGFAFALSKIKDDVKKSVNKLVSYTSVPLSITILGTIYYVKTHNIVTNNISALLFSINFFIILFIINIFFKKNNISFKKYL